MKIPVIICLLLFSVVYSAGAQTITYSQVEKADNRDLTFEILGNFSGNFPVFKSVNKRRELTIYDNNMAITKTIKLDFISDRFSNIDFISYPDYFIMVWQYEKSSVIWCKAARMTGTGEMLGNVITMDSTKTGFFSNRVFYDLTWSEDRKKVLMYKTHSKNDEYDMVTKVYDENLLLLDSSKRVISYNDRREVFGDLLISNEGTIVFTKVRQNARPEFINSIGLNIKKLKNDSLITLNIPLDKELIQDPLVKIDNRNGQYIVNSFSYKNNGGNIDGMFTAVVRDKPLQLSQKTINIFDDSLRTKLSGRPDWRTAYDNLSLRNVILKKDGGFIVLSEEYYKQRRFGNFDDRYSPGSYNSRYYGTASDYYLYNRGYYGYYRPFNDGYSRDIIYNYNDIVAFSLTKDLRPEWNNVINKTTSDIENDNFLSFTNMNAGGEIHFLFLQKDNNRQILSDHALQPNGSVNRYATLKGREAGYYFMPRLGRQTGLHQMIIPCIVRNNIAFAKIDF
ncbi:MAG: hypothetical protein WKF88_10575 [Ferruginibacter sp.]